MRIIILILALLLVWYLFKGTDDENVQMNAYYYRSSDLNNFLYLGQVKGLSACHVAANYKAQIEKRRRGETGRGATEGRRAMGEAE